MKFLNLSYNDPERWREVQQIAGDAFPFFKSMRMGGTGSPKAILTEAPEETLPWMTATVDRVQCNIEMRSQGFILRFRCRQEVMAWVISKGNVERVETHFELGKGQHVSIHTRDRHCLKLESNLQNAVGWKSFLRRHFSTVLHEEHPA